MPLTPQTFQAEVLAQPGTVRVLFGQSDPETTRIKKVLSASGTPWHYVDIDSSDGAQVAMRAGVRVSPVVYEYQGGDVAATSTTGEFNV